MTTTSPIRRFAAATTAAVGLLASASVLGTTAAASASEWVSQDRAGYAAPAQSMTIGYDVQVPTPMGILTAPRVKAGPLVVGPSPASPYGQRVEVKAFLHRWDTEAGAWRSAGTSDTLKAWVSGDDRVTLGEGGASSAWSFTNLGTTGATYEVVYSATWYQVDLDSDPSNDKYVGAAILKPSVSGDHTCQVTHGTTCSVSARGVTI